MFGLVSILFAFITCVFPSLKNLVSIFLIEAGQQFVTSRHKFLLSKNFWVFSIPLDRQPNPSSQISKLSVCSIEARHLLDPSKKFGHRHLLNTSRSIEFMFLTPLDISLLYRDAWIYIYLRLDPILFSLKYFDLFLFSLDPNLCSSLKSFFPFLFRPLPSFNPSVSGLYLFFSSSFMQFLHLDLDFLSFFGGKFRVFEFLSKFLGWVLL